MHLMDNIFLLRSFTNTYDTLFLIACAVNPLTCVYAEDLLVFCAFFFLPLLFLGHMLETLKCSIFLLREKSRKAHLKIFSFFSASRIRSKSEKREEINFNSINNSLS